MNFFSSDYLWCCFLLFLLPKQCVSSVFNMQDQRGEAVDNYRPKCLNNAMMYQSDKLNIKGKK